MRILRVALIVASVSLILSGCESPLSTDHAPASETALTLPITTPVILISIDTLRSDRLPAYGYTEVETPAIDKFRAESILFEHAYSQMALTLPSHTSIFSGLWPVDTQVRDNIGYRVSSDVPLLPELLQQRGYTTLGAVSTYVLRATTGIARGFDHYDDGITVTSGAELGALQRSGLQTLEVAVKLLEANTQSGKPPFLFFHIYEPHTPNDPPEPFRSRYPSLYDGEVAEADLVMGRLFAELKRLELYDNALIILLSDHGEGLNDHGEYEHEILLYREVLQVPLMVRLPRSQRGGTSVQEPAQLVDVLPTVLNLLSIKSPPTSGTSPSLRGTSLFDLRNQDRLIFSESTYPKIHFGWSDLASMIDGRYHYIHGPKPELYDMKVDPGETNNILQVERAISRKLSAAIQEIDRTLLAPAEVDEETKARLLSLGYVTGGTTRSGPLPNPIDKIGVLEDLGLAARALTTGNLAEAATRYRAVAEADPGMVYAWEQLGKTLRKTGDTKNAIAAYEKAMAAAPNGSGPVALSLAEVFLETNQLDTALEYAKIAVATQDAAHDLLAQIAILNSDLNTAEQHLNTAVRRRSGRIQPLITRVSLLIKQGRFEESLAAADEVAREFGSRSDVEILRGLEFERGTALARLNRLDQATIAFRSEIQRSPTALAPYSHLALLQALQGDAQATIETLRAMTTTNDNPRAYAEAAQVLRTIGDPNAADSLIEVARRRFPGARALH